MARQLSASDLRIQAIADHLGIAASAFYAEKYTDAVGEDASLEELRRAFLAAADAYMQGLHRAAQSVSLSGQS